jgi:hypothetical protein
MSDDIEDEWDEEPETKKGPFICPECGSGALGGRMMVEPMPDGSAWSSVCEVLVCGGCGSEIPAHLGERWDGLSAEDAEVEWELTYRKRGKRRSRR